MATVKSQIDITAKDSTAAAFASVNSGLSGLASAALKVGGTLSALGATAVIGSFAAFTKQTIEAQDNLSKLAQKTGIAVESLAGLEFAAEQSGVELDKVAKATRTFSLLVVEAADSSSEAAKKLSQLGLSYKDLKDQSPEKQLLQLADALNKFSKQDQAVAFTSIFGNKMADLIPLLAGGSKELGALIEQGKKFNPITAQSAKQAELFNDQLNVLSKSVSSIGRDLVQGMIPGLSAVADRMAKVTQESGFLAGALAGVKELFIQSFGNPKILGDVGQIRREIFKTQETINNLSNKKDSIFFDKNALEHEKDKLAQLEIDLQKAIGTSRDVIAAQDANAQSTKKFAIALDETAPKIAKQVSAQDALKKAQSDALSIEHEYIKLLQIERKAREDLLKPYQQEAQSAEERLDRMRQEAVALELSQRKQISLEQAIEETTIARLEEKRAATSDAGIIDALNREIATRKQIIGVIKTSEDRTKQLKNVTANATDDISQLWMQAGRNIQSALANGIFNFFDDGLKGMVKNVVSTVGRILSEFAALKLAQSIGLAGMFGGAGTAAASGIGGTGSSALNIASLGSNALSIASSGFGATSLIGSGLTKLGGVFGSQSLSAFGGGFGGDALGGLAAGGFSSGAAGAASLGSSIGAIAGPAIALAAVDAIGRAFAGDKKLGGAEMIPVLGGFLAGFFGHGPLKFRQQSLQGTASNQGLDGDISNVFRAKGGLLVGNNHKTVTEQFTLEQKTLFDTTLKGFYGSAHQFAVNLGLSTDLVDNFTKEVQVKSEKGKQLTEEAIADMLKGIGNSLAQNLLPSVDSLRKAGEDSFATLTRLNTELVTLTNSAEDLGATSTEAASLVKSMSLEARTAFVDMAGGAEALAQKTAFVFQNFLTGSQQLDRMTDDLSVALTKLGLSAKITKDQYFALITSTDTANDLRVALLNLAPQFVNVAKATENASNILTNSIKALPDESEIMGPFAAGVKKTLKIVVGQFDSSVAASLQEKQQKRINDLLENASNAISAIGQGIEKLLNLAGIVKNAVGTIAPQSVDDARASILGGINRDRKGNVRSINGADSIDQGAIATLSSQTASGFSSRLDFQRSQGKNLEVLNLLSLAVSKSIAGERGAMQSIAGTRNGLPSFDVGGIVPKTSIAMVHKGERIINPQQNEALIDILQKVLAATMSGASYSQSVYGMLKNISPDGTSIRTVAA